MKFCPECGAAVLETNKFCPNCGSRLQAPEEPTAPPPAPPEEAAPAAPTKDMSGLPPAWMPPPVQPGTGVSLEHGRSASTDDDEPADTSSVAAPPSWMPPPIKSSFGGTSNDRPGGLEAVDEDFKMSDLGPPPPPKRRLWLWIPLGIVGAVIVCCIVFTILSETVLEDTFDRWATQIAADSTEESVVP